MTEISLSDRIGGYCDGLIGNQIVGWVVNHDRSHALECVIVKSDLGERLEFKAIVYRLDIAATFGRHEKFGFAIPLTALPNFERTIRLFNRNGELIENGVVDLSSLQAPPPPRHPHCSVFLHIQKTAGTSLSIALQRQVRDGEVCLYYPGHVTGLDWDTANMLPPHQCKAFKLLIGHAAFGMGAFLRQPTKYYTFLREPIARLKSHYWHYRAAKMDPLNNKRESVPLHIALNEGLTDEFDNLQTRMVAGVASESVPLGAMSDAIVALALHNIDCSFGFVGLTERMDADAKKMYEKMGIEPVTVGRENVTESSIVDENDEHYRLIDWDKVRENNKYDIDLYRTIASRSSCGDK